MQDVGILKCKRGVWRVSQNVAADGCRYIQEKGVQNNKVSKEYWNISIKPTVDMHCSCIKDLIRKLLRSCLQWELESNSHFPWMALKKHRKYGQWQRTHVKKQTKKTKDNDNCCSLPWFHALQSEHSRIALHSDFGSLQLVLLFRLWHILTSRSAPQSRQPTPLSVKSFSMCRVGLVWIGDN